MIKGSEKKFHVSQTLSFMAAGGSKNSPWERERKSEGVDSVRERGGGEEEGWYLHFDNNNLATASGTSRCWCILLKTNSCVFCSSQRLWHGTKLHSSAAALNFKGLAWSKCGTVNHSDTMYRVQRKLELSSGGGRQVLVVCWPSLLCAQVLLRCHWIQSCYRVSTIWPEIIKFKKRESDKIQWLTDDVSKISFIHHSNRCSLISLSTQNMTSWKIQNHFQSLIVTKSLGNF